MSSTCITCLNCFPTPADLARHLTWACVPPPRAVRAKLARAAKPVGARLPARLTAKELVEMKFIQGISAGLDSLAVSVAQLVAERNALRERVARLSQKAGESAYAFTPSEPAPIATPSEPAPIATPSAAPIATPAEPAPIATPAEPAPIAAPAEPAPIATPSEPAPIAAPAEPAPIATPSEPAPIAAPAPTAIPSAAPIAAPAPLELPDDIQWVTAEAMLAHVGKPDATTLVAEAVIERAADFLFAEPGRPEVWACVVPEMPDSAVKAWVASELLVAKRRMMSACVDALLRTPLAGERKGFLHEEVQRVGRAQASLRLMHGAFRKNMSPEAKARVTRCGERCRSA